MGENRLWEVHSFKRVRELEMKGSLGLWHFPWNGMNKDKEHNEKTESIRKQQTPSKMMTHILGLPDRFQT
jgi:hypothetical protein